MKDITMLAIIGLFGIGTSHAQITKVDQEVYGMDCAPCAYGLERGLKKMEGLKYVRVSLNDGKAYLELATENKLTLQDIQEEVKKNGFSAKKAQITISGTVKKENGLWVIETGQELFDISQHSPTELVQALTPGMATVSGTVEDEEDGNLSGRWAIILTKVK
ncbi:heavy-metal-associated domain-containing protein [Muriicola sp. E247]|uniref:heavy-metal-associated domain-containing protein n=1 Tax=unclassified Muriicola TaxID=2647561 RepID=UPI00350EE066